MVDLSAEMAELWDSLGPPASGRARVLQFVAARRGEGTSTVAREFAHFAARRTSGAVWLVDLDLLAAPQHAAIAAAPQRYGALGEAAAATPDGSMFFTVQPPIHGQDGRPWPDAAYISAHRVGSARWWVTRFRREALRARQTVHLLAAPDYWNALRRHADLVVVDAPAPARSQAAVSMAPFMDDSLLVVSAEEPDVKSPARLRDALQGAGGRVAGLFVNRVSVEAPPFLKDLLP